jgi:hypothetical protein
MSLRPLTESPPLIAALERFPALYERALVGRFLWRLGHQSADEAAGLAFVSAAVRALMASPVPIDRFFLDWRRGESDRPLYQGEVWDEPRAAFAALSPLPGHLDHDYWRDAMPCSMHIDEVEQIWSAISERDDWEPLNDKVLAIRRMGTAHGPVPHSLPSKSLAG